MPKRKSSGIGWVTFFIAIIALGLAGYSVFSPIIKPSPRASVYVSEYYSAPVGTFTSINFDEVIFDTHNAFNLNLDVFIAPQKGYYMVIGQVSGISFLSTSSLRIGIYINTTEFVLSGEDRSESASKQATASGVLWLEKGWTISMKYYTGSSSGNINKGVASTYLTIYKVN